MLCPSCQGPSRVAKTMDTGADVTRIHECISLACDAVWTTDQRLRPGSIRTNRRAIRRCVPPSTAISVGVPPPTTVGEPSTAANSLESRGGVGGGLPSALSSSALSPSDPSQQSDQEDSRARAVVYPAEFALAWDNTAKTGSKFKAFEAWKRLGRPTANQLVESWRKWAQLDGWRRGFVPHVVTWLNGRCWEQEPTESRATGRAGPAGRTDGNVAAALDWHETGLGSGGSHG